MSRRNISGRVLHGEEHCWRTAPPTCELELQKAEGITLLQQTVSWGNLERRNFHTTRRRQWSQTQEWKKSKGRIFHNTLRPFDATRQVLPYLPGHDIVDWVPAHSSVLLCSFMSQKKGFLISFFDNKIKLLWISLQRLVKKTRTKSFNICTS